MEVIYSKDLKHAYFNGIEFYRHGNYFDNNKYGLLHRYIYSYYNGKIPEGYDIHHKDENKMNNDISNLILLTRSEHMKLHGKDKEFFKGKHHSEESRKKISEANKGKKRSEETKRKISKTRIKNGVAKGENNPMYGVHRYAENNPNWIPITDEMIVDYKNGIDYKDFCTKYNVSTTFWYKKLKKLGL